MKEGRDNSLGFNGTRADVAPQLLDRGLFQIDQGGDRFRPGSWRRRKGMVHSDQPKLDSAITSILGFELAGEDFALAAVEGTNIHGFLNVEEQNYGFDTAEGFGESDFGEDFGD